MTKFSLRGVFATTLKWGLGLGVVAAIVWGGVYAVNYFNQNNGQELVQQPNPVQTAVAPVLPSPRPQVAGRDMSDLDMYVLSQETEASTYAFYCMVCRELGLQQCNADDLFAIRNWMASWKQSITTPSPDEINGRTKALIELGGASGWDNVGKVVPIRKEFQPAISEIVAKLTN